MGAVLGRVVDRLDEDHRDRDHLARVALDELVPRGRFGDRLEPRARLPDHGEQRVDTGERIVLLPFCRRPPAGEQERVERLARRDVREGRTEIAVGADHRGGQLIGREAAARLEQHLVGPAVLVEDFGNGRHAGEYAPCRGRVAAIVALLASADASGRRHRNRPDDRLRVLVRIRPAVREAGLCGGRGLARPDVVAVPGRGGARLGVAAVPSAPSGRPATAAAARCRDLRRALACCTRATRRRISPGWRPCPRRWRP